MIELKQYEIDNVSGGMVVAVWALFLTGYGAGAFGHIGSWLGSSLYDAAHNTP